MWKASKLTVPFPEVSRQAPHGEPVPTLRNTASRNRRLSRAVMPRLAALPGSNGAVKGFALQRAEIKELRAEQRESNKALGREAGPPDGKPPGGQAALK